MIIHPPTSFLADNIDNSIATSFWFEFRLLDRNLLPIQHNHPRIIFHLQRQQLTLLYLSFTNTDISITDRVYRVRDVPKPRPEINQQL
ncbi:MAG: hypothetical protein WBB29_16835 [Geitlerinemataceae cyanobacterium]